MVREGEREHGVQGGINKKREYTRGDVHVIQQINPFYGQHWAE